MKPDAHFSLIPILLILLISQFLLYRRSTGFITGSHLSRRNRRLLIAVLRLLFISLNIILIVAATIPLAGGPSSPYLITDLWNRTPPAIVYPLALWHVGSIGSLLMIFLMDTLRMLRKWDRKEKVHELSPVHMPRREFFRQVGGGLAILPFGISMYGGYTAREGATLERIALSLPHLPEALRGLKIVQLTDIHVGPFMSRRQLENVVKIVNRLEPDLVVITGDFIASSNRYVAPAVEALSQLRARLGVFGSIGNHEHHNHAIPLLIEGFTRNNMKILLNENVILPLNGARLNLVGIDYVDGNAVLFDKYIRGIPLERPTILLSHQPNVFPKAAGLGIELTLSGHTHGGQVNLDFFGLKFGPADLFTPYVAGLFELGASKLYVSRGLGTSGFPVRISAPPEITLMTLT